MTTASPARSLQSGGDAFTGDFRQAAELQRDLARRVRRSRLRRTVRTVAAVDVSYIGPFRRYHTLVAGAVAVDVESGQAIERRFDRRAVTIPYVPGFLSFREAPAAVAAVAKLRREVDAILVDGQGLAHPRRFGLACHIGVLLDRPTVGCAKSRLTGEPAADLPAERGAAVDLLDGDEVIGRVVRTRAKVKPLYVSVGHRIALDQAVELVLALTGRYRLPEPARLAHNYVTELKRRPSKP